MITKQQYDEAKKLIEEYENQPKHDFIPGEFVQGRDTENESWLLRTFLEFNGVNFCSKSLNCYWTNHHKFIRRPVDVPGILVRWTGGECPVGDKNAIVAVVLRSGYVGRNIAGCWVWTHDGECDDIIAYMILPEHMK